MKYYLREAGDRVGIVVGAVKGGLAAKLCRRVEEFEGQSLVYGRRWHYARSPFRKQRKKGSPFAQPKRDAEGSRIKSRVNWHTHMF